MNTLFEQRYAASRRQLIQGLGLAGAAMLLPLGHGALAQVKFASDPYRLGIASGDAMADGFVIWTKLAPEPLAPHGGMPLVPMPVAWEVATDTGFREVVAKGEELARPELGHSVHVEIAGLQPNRPYYYRFTAGGERSLRGTARTLPLPGSKVDTVKFGVCGCQHFESGYFGAYCHLAREELDFVYHFGDFIYEYRQEYLFGDGLPSRPVRQHAFRNLIDLSDYRIAYGQQLGDVDLQSARSTQTFMSSFDDHEIHNNWVADIDADPVPPEIFMLRKQGALQAWYEHMPVRRGLLPFADISRF